MDRRNSEDRTPRHSENPNVFDDEFAVDPDEADFMPSVSDGFRPARLDEGTHDVEREFASRPSLSISKPSDPNSMRRIASRNSTVKTPFAPELFEGRPSMSNHNRGAGSQGTALQHRASISSNGSFATMARSESPFGAAPSHPYGMYAQNTSMGRSASVTTSSTLRHAHRPAHPYGMYAQNVVEDSEEPPLPTAAPVGFPGRLNTGYHRRIGPDGEEQDIVGPDGHMEQLPPYSRYPEEGPTKAAMAAEESATPVGSPVAGPMAIPISPPANTHANASEDRLISPTRNSAQPEELHVRDVPSGPPSTIEQPLSEKQETKQKGSSSWASRRLWGKIPLGVVLILLVLVLIFAIILGAAIGTFVARGNNDKKGKPHPPRPQDPQAVTVASASMFYASPIAVPSGLPSLPSGSFILPLGSAQESSPSCLTVPNQLSAWSCKTMAPLLLNVNNTTPAASGNRNNPAASIGPFTKPDGGIQYGVQPPNIQTQSLQLVVDSDYRAYGPAWHFQGMYDKVVILDQDDFAAGATVSKRQDQGPPKGGDKNGFRHRFQVLPGDFPWFCIWNSTFIEGYIFVSDNSTAATMTSIPSGWPSSNPIIPSGSAALLTTSANVAPSTISPGGPRPTSWHAVKARGDGDYPKFPPYPRIVKIEERRVPNSPQPYCQKMQLLDSGVLVPVRNSNNQPLRIQLQEQDPSMEEFQRAAAQPPPGDPVASASSSSPTGKGKRATLDVRRDPGGACHCQWMFQ